MGVVQTGGSVWLQSRSSPDRMLDICSCHKPEARSNHLQMQWSNHHDVLIEFDSKVDVEWVVQKLLRMEQWMGPPCNLEYSNEEGL